MLKWISENQKIAIASILFIFIIYNYLILPEQSIQSSKNIVSEIKKPTLEDQAGSTNTEESDRNIQKQLILNSNLSPIKKKVEKVKIKKVTPPPPTRKELKLKLLGIFGAGGNSSVLISTDGKAAKLYKLKDRISGNVSINQVNKDAVVLSDHGKDITLRLNNSIALAKLKKKNSLSGGEQLARHEVTVNRNLTSPNLTREKTVTIRRKAVKNIGLRKRPRNKAKSDQSSHG